MRRFLRAVAGLALAACSGGGVPDCPEGSQGNGTYCVWPLAGTKASKPTAGAGGRSVPSREWPVETAGRGGEVAAGAAGAAGDSRVDVDAGELPQDAGGGIGVGPECGNGIIEPGEICDGNCPDSCDTSNACIVGTLIGKQCSRSCKQDKITSCMSGDGCCPAGCDHASDTDCSKSCGDGEVQDPETCDGDCPESCDDSDACTVDMMTGAAAQCSVTCSHEPTKASKVGDGCCPAGANASTDPDCPHKCGDGVVTGGEVCEASGAKKCPASCDDSDLCTTDSASGSAGECSLRCSHTKIPTGGSCGDGLRCDAAGECVAPMCGDGTVDEGETCDGNCPTSCPQPTDPNDECKANVLVSKGPCSVECRAGVKSSGTVCANRAGACDGPDGDCIRNIWFKSCANEAGCFEALRCRANNNICTAQCSVDNDCGLGGVCWQGWCDKPCQNDGGCSVGQACVDLDDQLRCRPRDCWAGGDPCPEGFTCREVMTTGGGRLSMCLP